jgi:drug/metabolite transporter (DMT)-like permease
MWTALMGWWILREPIVGPKRQGLALIIVGVGFMGWQALNAPHGMAEAWKGDLIFPLASLSWSIYIVNAKRWGVKPLDAIIVTPLVAFALFAPFYWWLAPKNLQAASLTMVLGHGVFQGCIALTLSMWLFGKMVIAFGPVRTTMITALAPPMAALVAVPVLDEPLTWFVVAGLLCVVVGTVVGVRPARAP